MRRITATIAALMCTACLLAAPPPRRLFDHERREGDIRPKPDLTPPIPSPRGEGKREGSYTPAPAVKGPGVRTPGWQPNGIIVCDTANCSLPKIVSDGKHGAIICWTENHRGADSVNRYSDDIYAQRVDSGGNFVWQNQGVPVCSLSGSWSNYPAMIPDGKGGAIIAWEDGRDGLGYTRVFAQRLDSLGNRLWPENGVLVCNQMSGYVDLCTDGHGGAIVAYVDGRDEANTSDNIYAQRIDSAGNPVWAIDGVPVCTADSIQFWPYTCCNSKGGTLITWEDDYRNNSTTGKDVYAQMLDSVGNAKWIANGELICNKPGTQRARNPIANMHGGGMFYWWAFTDTNLAYGQSLDSTGSLFWGPDGRYTKLRGDLSSDKRGGFIISSPITVQRIDSNGSIAWGAGIAVYPDSGGLFDAREDGEGGIVTICDKLRNNPFNADQYAQRVDSSGNLLWNSTGVPVCTLQVAGETYPQVESDGLGGAISAWHGWRPGSRYTPYRDIIAQRVYANGTPGGVGYEPADVPSRSVMSLQAYPNPMYRTITIRYSIPRPGKAKVTVYNAIGQKVVTLQEGRINKTEGIIGWDGVDQKGHAVSSGVYICSFEYDRVKKQVKILKVK